MMLRKGRIVFSWLFLAVMTLTFCGVIVTAFPKWQVMPALLAGNFIALAFWLVLTVLFGRVYCSIICPLGIAQDFVSWLAERRNGKSHSFSFQPERRLLRYGVLALTALTMLAAGTPLLAGILDPYSIYGRIVTDFLSIPARMLWNVAASLGAIHGFVLARIDMLPIVGGAAALAAVQFVLIAVLAWRYGRWYCNNLCPVGTLLGTVSRVSLFRPAIVHGDCIHCGLCERTCRASCIDISHGRIDTSRCVDCFDCVAICPKGAIKFVRSNAIDAEGEGRTGVLSPVQKGKPSVADKSKDSREADTELSRRQLLASSAAAIGAAAVTLIHPQRLLSGQDETKMRTNEVRPPGAAADFATRCTSCHICVNRCPSGVLVSATLENGILQFGEPYLDFSRGYCVYNCNFCTQACPAGAIQPLDLARKQQTKIGVAHYVQSRCLITTEGIVCGNCARHCPTKAIDMVEAEDGHSYPQVNKGLCIGCGACEYHCPAKPVAISVAARLRRNGVRR